MYSSFHAVSGLAVSLPIVLLTDFTGSTSLAYFLAIWSHHFVDHLGESECYGGFKNAVIRDGIMLTGAITLSAWYVFGYEAAIICVLANVMDYIDKFRSQILKKKELFPCHQSYHKILVRFSPLTTLRLNYGCAILMVLLAMGKVAWGVFG